MLTDRVSLNGRTGEFMLRIDQQNYEIGDIIEFTVTGEPNVVLSKGTKYALFPVTVNFSAQAEPFDANFAISSKQLLTPRQPFPQVGNSYIVKQRKYEHHGHVFYITKLEVTKNG